MNLGDLRWYHSLHQPRFSPPDWLFAPAWGILYAMIFLSLLFFVKGGDFSRKTFPLAIYSLQLILNVLWTPIFFGAKKILLALIIVLALVASTAVTIFLFYKYSKIAAILLIPYFLWICYATYLNFEFWRLNR